MPTKTITIIIGTLIFLIAIFFGGAFLISRDTGTSTGEVLRNIIPFGGDTGNISREGAGAPSPITERGASGGGKLFSEVAPLELRQLTTVAISGAAVIEKAADQLMRVYYVERATGNIFSADPKTGTIARVTNTTIPGVREIAWGRDNLILRYSDEDIIKSRSASFGKTGAVQELTGVFLPDNIAELVVSPDKARIFYLLEFGSSVIGTIANIDGSKKKQVFDSTHREWLPDWNSNQSIVLTTKPSGLAAGFAYSLDITTGDLREILGNVTGLTVKPSLGAPRILYGKSTDGGYETFLYSTKTGESAIFPIATLPEKCVWGNGESTTIYCGAPTTIPQDIYPDSWYQGLTSFEDALWKVETETLAVTRLSAPQESVGQSIDVQNPFLNEDESYLFFTNKKDSTLWGLRLR